MGLPLRIARGSLRSYQPSIFWPDRTCSIGMVSRPRWGASAASNRRQRQVISPRWGASASSNRILRQGHERCMASICQQQQTSGADHEHCTCWLPRPASRGCVCGQAGCASVADNLTGASAARLRLDASSSLQDSQLCSAIPSVHAQHKVNSVLCPACMLHGHQARMCCATHTLRTVPVLPQTPPAWQGTH